MSDYSQTRKFSSAVTSRFREMLVNLEGNFMGIELETDDLGIWLVNKTPDEVQQIGHVSWKEVTRGVQQCLLQEKFLIVLSELEKKGKL